MSRPRVVDVHSHLYPESFRAAGLLPPYIFDVAGLLRQQAEAGVDVSIVSNPMIVVAGLRRDLTALDAIREYHAFAATLQERHPSIRAMAACNYVAGETALRECERALEEYGFVGVVANSSVDGRGLDDPSADALVELCERRGIPLFVHPPALTIGMDRLERWRLPELLGRPFDTTWSLARFVLSGGFIRHPEAIVILAHMGGGLAMLSGRLDFGYALRGDPSYGPWEPDVLPERPSTYLRRLYVDTMGFHPPAVRLCVETFGAEHVCFGSDFPPVNIPLREGVETVRRAVDGPVRDALLGGNAERIFRL